MKVINLFFLLIFGPVYVTAVAQQSSPGTEDDFAGINARGDQGMGFSHEKTTHHFHLLADGGPGSGGSRLYKTQMPIKETGLVCTQNTYILCYCSDTALSFSWLAQPGWTSQEHGIMF
jgi:hypothetical protein